MKRFFLWLLKNNNSKDISSLVVILLTISFVTLYDYQTIRKHLFLMIPFFMIVLISMRILEEIVRKVLGPHNKKISDVYFILSIFLVIIVTTVIKSFY